MWKERLRAWMQGNKRIKVGDLVISKKYDNPEFGISKVIGMSHLDLTGIGPLLIIRDTVSGKRSETFPMYVDRLVREKTTWRQRVWEWGSEMRHKWLMRNKQRCA